MRRLQSLRPDGGADLLQLQSVFDGRGWRSGLPGSLPDDLLLRLARDFRCVEVSLCSADADPDAGNEDLPALAPAMYTVMNLLVQHPDRNGATGFLDVSQSGLIHAIQLYQWELEREIVARIVGLSRPDQSTALLQGLWRCVHE